MPQVLVNLLKLLNTSCGLLSVTKIAFSVLMTVVDLASVSQSSSQKLDL